VAIDAIVIFTTSARNHNVLLQADSMRRQAQVTEPERNMPKSMRVGLWLGIGCLALALQGCWDDGQENLTLLGEGGCRAADGGHGHPRTVPVASAEDCEAQCFAEATPCVAVEYNSKNGACEVHSEPIARFEHVEGVACYAMR
jgi:hypothetical protein